MAEAVSAADRLVNALVDMQVATQAILAENRELKRQLQDKTRERQPVPVLWYKVLVRNVPYGAFSFFKDVCHAALAGDFMIELVVGGDCHVGSRTRQGATKLAATLNGLTLWDQTLIASEM